MVGAAAVLAVLVLVALGVFQALLVAGRPLGRYAWGGQHEVLPRNLRIGSCVAILLYVVFALIILSRSGLYPVLTGGWIRTAHWVLTVYLFSGVILNGISRSRPERLVMTPVTALLALLCLYVAVAA
jgi:hypothetical protein